MRLRFTHAEPAAVSEAFAERLRRSLAGSFSLAPAPARGATTQPLTLQNSSTR
ncbi:hypothetical protein EES45_08800 [Streptomyces sp. ADI97-07]|nr:hypothetical protein EES45_08800 [Streptomyces sp. ADI97-07]